MGRNTSRFKVQLEPQVVKWIVESSGMDHGTVAQKMNVDKAQVSRWIDTGVMEYSKMRNLAKCIKRAETLFLLKSPPHEKKMTDYRLAKGTEGGLIPEDIVTVRRARYAQSVAREMMEVRNMSMEPLIPTGVTAAEPPDAVARSERGRLGVEVRPDGALKGAANDLYGILREAIEVQNIFVFQNPLDADSVRGLALTGSLPDVILVNSRDTSQAKTFTLIHEYGHLLLRRGGICGEQEATPTRTSTPGAETWCNRFAASFLMPEEEFVAEREKLECKMLNAFDVTRMLAKKFKVSAHAAAVRAADIQGSRLKADYMAVIGQLAGRHSVHKPRGDDEDEGRPKFVDVRLSQLGRKFTRLVLVSDAEGIITSRDVLDYLRISLKHLDKIRARCPLNER